MKNKLILIDGNNIAYRAFYALPQTIATSTGIITNAVYGFTTMVLKLIDDQKPDNIIVAFDSKAPTFRHELFKDYKAQRKKMPDELISQFPLIKEVLESISIESIEAEGYEADDIIATLANESKIRFNEILIVSGDKDILQLVGGNLKVMALKKGITETVIYDKNGVVEKFGVEPDKIKDLLALTGDSSDNIPGVRGIGPKTAETLIRKYGSIESIYDNINDIKNNNIKKLLTSNKADAFNSKKLTELVGNLKLNIDGLLNKELNEINFNKIEKIFDSLEFKILKERIKKMSVYLNSAKHQENETKGSIQSLAEDLNGNGKEMVKLKFGVVGQGFNVESLINNSNGKLFISLCENCKEKEKSERNNLKNIVIFNGKDDPYVFNTNYLQDENYLKILRILFEDENIIKSGVDLKRFYKYLRTYQITMNGKFYDYKIFYLLLNPNKTDASIKEILRTYILENCDNYFFIDSHLPESDFEDKTFLRQDDKKPLTNGGENDAQLSFHMEMNVGKNLYEMDQKKNYVKYLAEDDNFKNTLKQILIYPQLEEILLKQIKEQELDNLYECIEGPLIKVLGEMEFTGISVDKEYLEFLINRYDKDIKILKDDIYEISGDKFNINSPQQLSNILFNKLGLIPARKTKTGLSTDAATLVSLVDENPIIEKILDYREKVKLRNTYIDVLPNLIDPKDNRIHTTYNQLGTTTGRLSSCDPNLQNIPVRTDLGKQIRKAFVPGKGYDLLLSSDYSQIELRILAHLSEDDGLIEVFNKNGDIHTFTASEIFNVSIEDVTEELRRKAKAINFGIIYGMTEYGLKSRLSISEDEAKEYIKLYFARYPKVKKYINFLIREAYEKGYATTLFGRKRYINELGSTNAKLRNLGERLAVNTPIQGSAADIMKLATVKLFSEIRKNNIDANILLQVHDELVLEIKEDDLDYVKTVVKNSMEACVNLKVLLKVEIKSAKNWYI